MSEATKRKHVIRELLEDFVVPTGNQQIVKVTGGRGNNLHEIVTDQGEGFLVSMPTKFRRNVWIKRGDYVVVEPIEEGNKVKAEITAVLRRDDIRHLRQNELWPRGFAEDAAGQEKTDTPRETDGQTSEEEEEDDSDSEEDDEGDDSDLFVNTNHSNHYNVDDDGDDDDDDE